MIETPLGVLKAAEIAGASPRVAALILGTSDLANDLHARPTRDRLPLLTALGLVLLAARAHGRAVLDGVHLALGDAEGFAMACRQGRELGFDGKTLIHPDQIAPANAIFAPSVEEVARASRLIAAYAAANASGKGAARFEGRLIEALHVDEAQRCISAVVFTGLGMLTAIAFDDELSLQARKIDDIGRDRKLSSKSAPKLA